MGILISECQVRSRFMGILISEFSLHFKYFIDTQIEYIYPVVCIYITIKLSSRISLIMDGLMCFCKFVKCLCSSLILVRICVVLACYSINLSINKIFEMKWKYKYTNNIMWQYLFGPSYQYIFYL
jgi:hypothetical protein